MQARLRDRFSAEVGPLRWVNDQNLSGAGCADFPGVRGESRMLDSWTSKGDLPDAQWDHAVRIVAEVTGEYGFRTPRVVVNRPSDHEITATDRIRSSRLHRRGGRLGHRHRRTQCGPGRLDPVPRRSHRPGWPDALARCLKHPTLPLQ
ncbi:MAG: LppA family lipoprotein [Pseudonocardiaceae bacterium]